MLHDAIDSVYVAVADLDTCRSYENLGLRLSPVRNGRRTLHVGAADNLFTVHFLADAGGPDPLTSPLRRALAAGRSLFAVALGVANFDAILGPLQTKSQGTTRFHEGEDEMAWLPLHDSAGTNLVLVRHARPGRERHDEMRRAGLLDHPFPLERLDHLAVVTRDLDEKTRYWSEVLGVPVAGEVTTPAMIIRQLRFSDAVLELLGPVSANSPLWQRTPGLASMASWEVADLDEAVGLARAAGFTVPDPGPGPLLGTRIASIQGSELTGVHMQLLQYEPEATSITSKDRPRQP